MKQLFIFILFITTSLSSYSKQKKEATLTKNSVPTSEKTTHSYVQGIDISDFQSDINWKVLKTSEVKFVFVKATGGIDYIDSLFYTNWKNVKQQDLKRGAYHFYYTIDDPVKQADFFIQTVLKLSKTTDLPPTLDLETHGVNSNITIAEYQKGVKTWLKIVEDKFKRKPIIYASTNFANKYLNDTFFSSYHLWIANYNTDTPAIPIPWEKVGWTFWQNNDSTKVKGIKTFVDHNFFNGTVKELNQL